MKITYLYNSGFCIQTKEFDIIIDFYKDSKDVDGIIYKEILPNTKKLYVLCTHSHLDHFNGEILNWNNKKKDITYIFSHDIFEAHLVGKSDAVFLEKFNLYKDDYISVKAYGSTDIGSSYYIDLGNFKIFHAGDLNNWHWNEESTTKEIENSEKFYADELSLISKDIKELDIAMFPIDPRLGKDFMKGAVQFIEAIKVKLLIPMHFAERYEKIALFENIANKYGTRYWTIKHKGETINI